MVSLKTLSEKSTQPVKSSAKILIDKLKTLSAKSSENIKINEELSSTWSNSYLSMFIRYGLFIIILAFLGLNLFAALGYLTEDLINQFKPILLFFGHTIGDTAKQTVDTSVKGAKAIVDTTKKEFNDLNNTNNANNANNANSEESAINILEQKMNPEKSSTMKALFDAQNKPRKRSVPNPDDSLSLTQTSRSSSKTGYCYVGEDRGYRSCIKVGETDECISGDIFPTREICINPNLRL